MRFRHFPGRLVLILALLPACGATQADDRIVEQPVISIIIDDLGNQLHRDRAAVELPGAIACSILPHTPFASELARLAHRLNKEVMLHLPMQAINDPVVGRGGITLDMTFQEFAATLQTDIASVPHVSGINNHMGSLLTQHPGHMLWLMSEINRHGNLFFVDSYTTKTSIGTRIADENLVPNIRRDVFLDHDRDPAAIEFQVKRLLGIARKKGFALAIGHPYPETVMVLRRELARLDGEGIRLIPVAELIRHHQEQSKLWQAYLSPSPKAVKN